MEWALIFLGGLLGSGHCVGMCGGFALSLGSASPTWRNNLQRQSVYTVGRVFTYSFLGAGAGFFGMWLTRDASAWINAQAVLAIVAGALLAVQGALAAGWLKRSSLAAAQGACLMGSAMSTFLTAPGLRNAFLAGLLTGFLPCGLVYAFLALAASGGDMWQGLATMALFGGGTAPLMAATGLGGSLLSLAARQRTLQLAAWCVLATGLASIVRGINFLGTTTADGCPMCQ